MSKDNKNFFKLGIGSKRKIRNFLLEPVLQIPLGVYVIAITFTFSVFMGLIVYAGLGRLYQLIIDLSDLPEDISALITDQIMNIAGWMIGFIALYAVTVIVATIIYTHRMVGPSVAFKRVISDLIRGNYSSRVFLRKKDAFRELADEINKLAEVLENQKKSL